MEDAISDEHLRIFKCLVDTGADVLRNTVERKLLVNTSFEQYLNQNKHMFYHQFEKRRTKPCCSGNPHNCVVNGKMDKKIFFKMYNKTAELDTQCCLDRFEVNADISVDKLDLSDLNFFLWNSAKLSTQEEQSLQTIMSTRSAICHSSSSRKYSLNELEIFWRSLKNDILLFAEPYRYKKSVEREMITLRNYNLNKTESKKILDEMHVELKKILHELKLEVQTKNNSIENLVKEENVGLKNCIRLENDSAKTHINEKMQELIENCEKGSRTMKRCKKKIKAKVQREGMKTRLQSKRNRNFLYTKLTDSERTVCQKVKSNKRRMNKLLELTQEGMNQNSKRFKSMQTQQTENNEKHQLTTIECKDEMKAKVIKEGRKTRLHNKDLNKSFHKKLTETEMRVCKRVAQSQTHLATKMEEEAHETRRQIETRFKILLGVLGKQKINLGINQEQFEELVESSDAQEIYITSKLDQQCLTADKEKNVIKNLQSEIQIPPSNDIDSDASEKQAFQVIVKKVNSIILKLKATPGIFKSVETLKSALLTLVKNVQIAGRIDPETEDTVTVNLSFDSPLTKDQIAVVTCLFSKEWNDDNDDKQLSSENASSGVGNICTEPETNSLQEKYEAVKRPLCQSCVEKDKQIKAYEGKTEELEKSITLIKLQEHTKYLIKPPRHPCEEMGKQMKAYETQEYKTSKEKYKLQGSVSTTRPYNCKNCFENDQIILQLDRRLCQIRRHLVQIKENPLSEKKILEGDLVKLITLATDTTWADENKTLTEKETKTDFYSVKSDRIDVASDALNIGTKTKLEQMELQSREVSLDKPYQPQAKSDLSSRLLELRHEYARNFYTKAEEQKGLAIIFNGPRHYSYLRDPDILHLQQFFIEMGFVIKCTSNDRNPRQLYEYMADGKYYCVFIVLTGYEECDITNCLLSTVHSRSPGKPIIVIKNTARRYFYDIGQLTDTPDTLMVSLLLDSRGSKRLHEEYNIFDDFMEVTRSNRFADIMEILTRMNAPHDFPVISIQSTLRKKLCFL